MILNLTAYCMVGVDSPKRVLSDLSDNVSLRNLLRLETFEFRKSKF